MNSGFGARLRAQREQQQIALAAIAEQTKIKTSLLEGLERDDLSHWPGGVFRRSYVRAYATAIGLDPEAVVREFQERFPEATDTVPEIVAVAQRAAGETLSLRPPTRLRFLIGSALEALPGLKSQLQASVGLGARPASSSHGVESAADRYNGTGRHDLAPSIPPSFAPEPGPADQTLFELTPPPAFALSEANDSHDGDGEIALADVAALCTRLAQAAHAGALELLLGDAARLLDAVGVTLWMWDASANVLHPVVTHGYSADLVAQLPRVSSDSENAIAAAFRAIDTRVVASGIGETGAVVVPLRTAGGCAGVLALELRRGAEHRPCVHACAEIIAAQLSTMVGYAPLVHAATA